MSGPNGPHIAAVYQLLTQVARMVTGHDRKLDGLSAEFAGMRGTVAGLSEIVASHDRKLDDLAAGLASLRDAVTHYHSSVLGHGMVDNIRDAVVVDANRFDRRRTRDIARDVARFNADLSAAGRPYLLIGAGRWGSADPLLGIPVTWDQIAGARAIVEAGFADFKVTPSQGSHFFQNLAAGSIGYFTVNPDAGDGFVDWEWLAAQPAAAG